jgi:hypothetical protein
MTKLFLPIFFIAAAGSLPAQARTDTRVPVTIVLAPDMGYGGANAVILRRPGGDPVDVILLRNETVTPEELTEAVLGLLSVRGSEGDVPTGEPRVLRVRAVHGGDAPIPWTPNVIRDLRVARPREIRGAGKYRAVVVLLLRQQGRTP